MPNHPPQIPRDPSIRKTLDGTRKQNEDPKQELILRKAGQPLARKLRLQLVRYIAVATFILGLLIGVNLAVGFQLSGLYWILGMDLLAIVVSLSLWCRIKARAGYSIHSLYKGVFAEERIGDAIYWALASSNCAIAHNVSLPEIYGDIDSLVMTGRTLWLIETKANWPARTRLKRTLSMLGANAEALRKRSPGFQVRAILVIESLLEGHDYGHDYGDVQALTRKQLAKQLRAAARASSQEKDPRIQKIADYIHEQGAEYKFKDPEETP